MGLKFNIDNLKTNINHTEKHRDMDRLRSGMSQIMTGSHRPVPNMRQKVTMRARGGDRRTVLQNRVSQFRKARDNDRIIRNRPLG